MKTHRIYDVSLSVYLGILVRPGNPPVSIDYVKFIARGASSNVSLLHIGSPARVILREL